MGRGWVDGGCRLEKDVEAKEDKQQLERKNTDDNEIKQKCIALRELHSYTLFGAE